MVASPSRSSSSGAKMLGGNALDATSTATSIRGDIVTDGPFAETKEALGGYYLIEAADLDQALAVAKLCPARAGRGGPADPGHVRRVITPDE